jgi:dissimilatory sulfite reductase (desulfoviridin) alpha/beta subunit
VIQCYQENAKKGERIGKMIDRVGMNLFQEAVSSLRSS